MVGAAVGTFPLSRRVTSGGVNPGAEKLDDMS